MPYASDFPARIKKHKACQLKSILCAPGSCHRMNWFKWEFPSNLMTFYFGLEISYILRCPPEHFLIFLGERQIDPKHDNFSFFQMDCVVLTTSIGMCSISEECYKELRPECSGTETGKNWCGVSLWSKGDGEGSKRNQNFRTTIWADGAALWRKDEN